MIDCNWFLIVGSYRPIVTSRINAIRFACRIDGNDLLSWRSRRFLGFFAGFFKNPTEPQKNPNSSQRIARISKKLNNWKLKMLKIENWDPKIPKNPKESKIIPKIL